MKKVVFISIAIILGGCSTAGPYVTNISSDGANGLNVEKCMIQYNSFTAAVSTQNCVSQHIQLTPPNYR